MQFVRGRKELSIAAIIALVIVGALAVLGQGVAARGNVGAPVRQTSGTGHTLAVQGHGETNVAPDQATITLGVQTKGADAQSSLSNNANKMNAVIAAVQAQGVPASHIQTSDLSLWYDSQNDSYVSSHQIAVRLDNVNKVGAVLDSAVGAGANNSWGVSFGLKDQSAAKAQALAKAVADARGHANSLASSLGVSVSGVGSASEVAYQYQPMFYGAKAAAAPAQSSAPTPVQPGELTVSADIQVTYTF